MELIENSKGWIFSNEEIEVFFGKKTFTEQNSLNDKNISLKFLKQVHGNQIILQDSSTTLNEGDAHFSKLANLALAIKTADCIPLMLFAKSRSMNTTHVMAMHAGWRGVANRIIPKGLSTIIKLGYLPAEVKIWIGPHILAKNFEVKADAISLLNAAGDSAGCLISLGDKTYFDLTKLAVRQIHEFAIPKANLQVLEVDTFQQLDLHSHRRDKDKAGRLISYIFKRY
jgi:polyphenol oxidase